MLAAGYDMNALVLDFPRADRCDGSSWETTLAAFEAARSATGAPAAVVASLPETMPEAIAGRLVAAGVAPFNGMSEALTAMRLAAEVGEAWASPASARLRPVGQAPTTRPARMLDEAEAKAALARFSLAVPAFRVAPIAEAARAAEGLGFPVVVKALSATLAHKTDVGGCEHPDDAGARFVALFFPGGDFGDEAVFFVHASVEALAAQYADFDFDQ